MPESDQLAIWLGLENFRQILKDLLSLGLDNINQATFDKFYPSYDFEMKPNKRKLLVEEINKQIKSLDPKSELIDELKQQLVILENMEDEFTFTRKTNKFTYEFVLKNAYKQIIPKGFIKILAHDNPGHRALTSWQIDKRDPIIFIAELIGNNKMFFHINLGETDGLAVIQENDLNFKWTHYLACEYSNLVNSESGSLTMDKINKEIKLVDGNIAAAMALSKAEMKTDEGISLFENNVRLMDMYKSDLINLDFNY